MALDTRKATVQERFEHLLAVISGQRFLKKQGLGNEVPFFLCAFDPVQAVEMSRMQRQLIKTLAERGNITPGYLNGADFETAMRDMSNSIADAMGDTPKTAQ